MASSITGFERLCLTCWRRKEDEDCQSRGGQATGILILERPSYWGVLRPPQNSLGEDVKCLLEQPLKYFRTVLTTHNAAKKRSWKESEIIEGNEIFRILEIIVVVKSNLHYFPASLLILGEDQSLVHNALHCHRLPCYAVREFCKPLVWLEVLWLGISETAFFHWSFLHSVFSLQRHLNKQWENTAEVSDVFLLHGFSWDQHWPQPCLEKGPMQTPNNQPS